MIIVRGRTSSLGVLGCHKSFVSKSSQTRSDTGGNLGSGGGFCCTSHTLLMGYGSSGPV